MEEIKELMEKVRQQEPKLTGFGMYSEEKYENDPIPEGEFILCMEWLKEQTISKTINRELSSYGMKHCVEEWHRKTKASYKYISNGSVIAAIIALGIPYQKYSDEPNIFAAVKVKK